MFVNLEPISLFRHPVVRPRNDRAEITRQHHKKTNQTQTKIPQMGDFYFGIYFFLGKRTAAWAAAKRAIGTRNGEQDTELNPT